MKIIGIGSEVSWRRVYIAEVSEEELNAVMDHAYGSKDKIANLKVGDEVKLSAGKDFRDEIRNVCSSMEASMKRFDESRRTLSQFAAMVAELPAGETQEKVA